MNVGTFKNLFKLSFVKDERDRYYALVFLDFFGTSSELVDFRLNIGIFQKFLGIGIE